MKQVKRITTLQILVMFTLWLAAFIGGAYAFEEYMGESFTSYEFEFVQGVHSKLYYYEDRVCLHIEFDKGVTNIKTLSGEEPILLSCQPRNFEQET